MNKQSKTLERTVILVSLPLTRSKIEALTHIYHVYGRILVEALEYRSNLSILFRSFDLFCFYLYIYCFR